MKPIYIWLFSTGLTTLILTPDYAWASKIHSCSFQQKKCIIKLEDGNIGDRVEVTDGKGRSVADGVIINKKGSYGIVRLNYKIEKLEIKSGDPVLIQKDGNNSNMQWAAAFSY